MTEISISIGKSIEITVKGHAGQAPAGHDIVCSAISAFTYTAAQIAVEYERLGWLTEPPLVMLESGNAAIRISPDKKHYKRISDGYHTIITGYRLVAETYPDYVKFISLTA